MTLLDIIFFIVLLVAYFSMYGVASSDIKETIKQYENESLWKLGVVDRYMLSILTNEMKTIVIFGAIAWPMYYLFKMGAIFGIDIYNLINNKNYENRIASWFV